MVSPVDTTTSATINLPPQLKEIDYVVKPKNIKT